MNKKIVAIWFSLAMVFSFIVILDVVKDFTPQIKGSTTLYVNETGTGGAYWKIQDAINDSKDGDTVFVYNGTYYENVVVNRTINLTGMNRDNTTIDGGGSTYTIEVISPWVNITGFNITGGSNSGIHIDSVTNSSIIGNNLSNNWIGIYLMYSNYTIIDNNNVFSNGNTGVLFNGANNNTISNNRIYTNAQKGIDLFDSHYNSLEHNNISFHFGLDYIGIHLQSSNWNNITENDVLSNDLGVWTETPSNNNLIFHNNFIDNVVAQGADDSTDNKWNLTYPYGGNHWSDWTTPDKNGDGFVDNPKSINGGVSEDKWPYTTEYGWKKHVHNLDKDTWHYTIQEGIDQAGPGNTIWVRNGTYLERVVLDKTVNLIGEDKDTTIIDGGGGGDVIRITADWVNLANFTVIKSGGSWGDAGIELYDVNNCRITNNIVKSNAIGIFVYWQSYDNIIDGNNVTSNGQYGIQILSNSNNNIIMNNNVSSNNWFGIDVYGSPNNYFWENKLINDGFFIDGTQLSHFNSQNIPTNNTVNDESVYYYKDTSGIDLDGIPIGQLILTNCSDIKAMNLQIHKADVGIEIAYSTNISIKRCNISSNKDYGIYFESSSGNNITDNNITDNGGGGIYFYWGSSSHNYLIGNNISGSWEGIWLDSSSNVISFNNISNNQYGIFHYSSSLNIIKNNEIISNFVGIHLSQSSHNDLIINNNISYGGWGITFWMTSNHDIINNNISYNNNGIGIQPSGTNNRIYHNNIFDNVVFPAQDQTNAGNEWDNGYPSGGNYWSKYSGEDNYKGPNQDIPGSDGIGDTPFVIDADSQDNYPLMHPYKPLENYTILKQGWNLISIPIIQQEQNLTRVLGSIDGWYDTVEYYNQTDITDLWKVYNINKAFGNDLPELNEKMGFWIYVNQPGDTIFLYNGTQPTKNQTINLYPGWNMVGYPSLTRYNRTDGLNNLTFGTHVGSIWTFDAANQKWEELGESDYFKPGRGYWIYAKVECTWEVPL